MCSGCTYIISVDKRGFKVAVMSIHIIFLSEFSISGLPWLQFAF